MLSFLIFILKIVTVKLYVVPPRTFFCKEYAKFLEFNYKIFNRDGVPNDFSYTTDYVHTAFLIENNEIVASAFVLSTPFHFDILNSKFTESEKRVNGMRVITAKCSDRPNTAYKYFYGERNNIIDGIFIFQLGVKEEHRKKSFSKILIRKIVDYFNPGLLSICVNPRDEYAAVNFHNYYNMNFHRLLFTKMNADVVMERSVDFFMNNMLQKKDLLEYLDREKRSFTFISMYALRDEYERSFAEEKTNLVEFGRQLCAKMVEYD